MPDFRCVRFILALSAFNTYFSIIVSLNRCVALHLLHALAEEASWVMNLLVNVFVCVHVLIMFHYLLFGFIKDRESILLNISDCVAPVAL